MKTLSLDYRQVINKEVLYMSAVVDCLHSGLLSRLYGKLLVLFEGVLQEVSDSRIMCESVLLIQSN